MDDGLLVEGVADLVFKEQTTWVVVDFKTDQQIKGDLEALSQAGFDLMQKRSAKFHAQACAAFLMRVLSPCSDKPSCNSHGSCWPLYRFDVQASSLPSPNVSRQNDFCRVWSTPMSPGGDCCNTQTPNCVSSAGVEARFGVSRCYSQANR